MLGDGEVDAGTLEDTGLEDEEGLEGGLVIGVVDLDKLRVSVLLLDFGGVVVLDVDVLEVEGDIGGDIEGDIEGDILALVFVALVLLGLSLFGLLRAGAGTGAGDGEGEDFITSLGED